MIRLGINSMPAKDTLLKFLEDPEVRQSLSLQVSKEQINIPRMYLRNGMDEVVKISPKKAGVKSSKKQESDEIDDEEQCTFEIDEPDDFDELWHTVSLRSRESQLKDKEESEAHIFQRLKESATKLTEDQLFALVKCHVKQAQMISKQQGAADTIRRSVDSEFHELFEAPHNHRSANNVLGSMYLKALMETYYDLRPGASSAKYKKVQEIISNFGKGEKDKFFDIHKYAKAISSVTT